ncbi:MAG: DNA-3-methyladenine glycosylase I [Candidatus Marinimicrobia bacterium]|nr:DNA-3-methyladenine glycosylase I [Candidatus Neomarinimicrobiota bacterium]MBL7067838.1 DNA-3-methyladenine glycosylase I [Candidatus Neomarinimicrobiota bacterium]
MKNNRCAWPANDPLMIKYHDTEWGVPVHDDRKLFEFLVLDAFQAGLSWSTILKKRENFRKAFNNFDPVRIAQYDAAKIGKLLNDAGIIRNKAKVNATVKNARAFLEVQKEFGTYDAYIWQFAGGKPIINKWKSMAELPAKSGEAEVMSSDLKKREFSFVGPTICYAFMQAAGMVNDHVVDCFRYDEINSLFR